MSSSVHFKFKSQKELSRVTFDGTGISVFELKREIINQNRLGDGSDFELVIYNEDTNEEYDDDTAIIPRSTSVIARRLPAMRPGKGGAARYVTGRMPSNARSSRPELNMFSHGIGGSNLPIDSTVQSEDEKIKALFNLQETQWKEQQNEMASATPITFGRGKGKLVNVPDHPPPPGYLCYRCREKGHWIQACPTNNDPKFDGRYRVKRSTGIPRSLQKQVEKPETTALDGSDDDPKLSGVMVNADGDFVIAQPDKASWELYQEKIKASAASAAENSASEGDRELHMRGLKCPIDKRLFLEPTKTPCCGRTYCNDCITNALIESDFICPNCSTEGVLLDNLSPDADAVAKIKGFEAEKTEKNDTTAKTVENSQEISHNLTSTEAVTQRASPKVSKKRSVEEREDTDEKLDVDVSPVMKRQKSTGPEYQTSDISAFSNNAQPLPYGQSPSFTLSPSHVMFSGPAFDAANNDTIGFFGGLPTQVISPVYGSVDEAWSQIPAMNFPIPGMLPNMFNSQIVNDGYLGFGGTTTPDVFSNQQKTAYAVPSVKEEENAYLRQPVNPYRHQGRQKRIRPSDYREL